MSETRLEAALWDLDGVIADTADYHYRAWKEIFAERGFDFKKEDFMQFFGRRHDTIIRFGLGDNLSPEEYTTLTDRKQRTYRRMITGHINALPGAEELIKTLHDNDILQAIASSAPYDNIHIITRGIGIEQYFQAIVSGLDVKESKPDPAIFKLAAGKLGAAPARCVVFEDAIAGVAAAKAAGMKCVAVTTSHPAESLSEADIIVGSLEQVTIDMLQKLIAK